MEDLAESNHPDQEIVLTVPRRRTADRQAPFGAGSVISNRAVIRLDLANSLRRYPNLFLGVTVVLFALLVLIALRVKPAYEAQALVHLEPVPGKLLGDAGGPFFDPSRYAASVQQQIQTATREDTLEQAVQATPAGMWRQPGESLEHAADRLGGAFTVKRMGETFDLAITSDGPDAPRTAAIVNAVTDAYLAQARRDANANTEDRLKLLGEERDKIQADLEAAHAEQARLSTSLGEAVPTGASLSNPYDAELSGTRTELVAAEQAHNVAVAQLASIRDQDGQPSAGLKAQAEELAGSDAGLSTLKSSVNTRRAQLNGLMAGMRPDSPLYRQYQNELNQLDAQVQARSAPLVRAAEERMLAKDELEVRRTGEIESRLRAQVNSGAHAAGGAAPKLQRTEELSAEITRLETRFATVDDAMRGLTLEATGPGLARLSVPAVVPTAPSSNKRKLLLLAALPLSLILGLLSAVVAAFLSRQVMTVPDLERVLGFAPMAVLPARRDLSEAAFDECLLRLAGALERAHRSAGARSFVFAPVSAGTSARELTQALDRKLALLGFSVTCLEADQLLHGDGGQNASERLSAWTQASDFVLFEAQPLLQSAGAEYAVSTVDATVLVVESGVATRSEVTRALERLSRLQVLGVGVILDGVPLRLAGEDLRAAVSHLEGTSALPAAAHATPEPAASAVAAAEPAGAPAVAAAMPEAPELSSSAEPATAADETAKADSPVPETKINGAAPAPPPQSFEDRDPMLPAWLAEALQPASATATPFVSTLPGPVAARPALVSEAGGVQAGVSEPVRPAVAEGAAAPALRPAGATSDAVPSAPDVDDPWAWTTQAGSQQQTPAWFYPEDRSKVPSQAAAARESSAPGTTMLPVDAGKHTVRYERPASGERPAVRAVSEASLPAAALPLPAPMSEAPRPRETGRVVTWSPRPAKMRPAVVPGQSAIYGPGAVPGAARHNEDPLPAAQEAGEVAVPSDEDSRRWYLLRRFDPRSRLFSPSLNQVPVASGHELDTMQYEPMAERAKRNGSGK